jgi:hypothetical protein
MSGKYQAFVTSNVAATILILSFVAPVMAQSTFPNFDYQKECEKWASPQMKQWKAQRDTSFSPVEMVNSCIDDEAAHRNSAEYKWQLASEDVRAKAKAQVDNIMGSRPAENIAGWPFYGYLDEALTTYSNAEARAKAMERLREKRPGVNY